jgi:hypothetical protein
MSTNLMDGLLIITAVSVATIVLCPLFCWLLAPRNVVARTS